MPFLEQQSISVIASSLLEGTKEPTVYSQT